MWFNIAEDYAQFEYILSLLHKGMSSEEVTKAFEDNLHGAMAVIEDEKVRM